MKISKLLTLIMGLLFPILLFSQTSYQAIVYFASGAHRVAPGDTLASVTSGNILGVLGDYSVDTTAVRPAFPSFSEADTVKVTADGDTIKQMNLAKLFVIIVSDTTTLRSIITGMQGLGEVLFAEPNCITTFTVAPNDTYYGGQWGLNNANNPGADIHAEGAWDIYTGNSDAIIAIIDEGVDIYQEDLSAKIVGGDDNYVTEIDGSSIYFSHGTCVAGVAAAITNNNTGVAGVDWQAGILPENIYDYHPSFFEYPFYDHGVVLIARKMYHAIDFSPDVWTTNSSFTTAPVIPYTSDFFTLRAAYTYAYKQNRVSCVSMGNTGNSTTQYPAGLKVGALIAVGGTDLADNVVTTSSRGSHMDVCAPGQEIETTNYSNSYYSGFGGTSAASAFVAGLASLLKGYNTSLYNDDIENIIKLSADQHVGAATPNDDYGYGRINAQRALQLIQAPSGVQHYTATGGSAYNTESSIEVVMLGALGLADAVYLGDRIEVRKTITLPTDYCSFVAVWGDGNKTTGFRGEPVCYGEGFSEVVAQTGTTVTLRTYVYHLYDALGEYVGYFPRSPSNVTFGYSILGIPPLTISGDNSFCTTSSAYSITNLPAAPTLTWSASPSGVVTVNTSTATTTTLSAIQSGTIDLTADITAGCTNEVVLTKTGIIVGGPTGVGILTISNLGICGDDDNYFQVLTGGSSTYSGSLTVADESGVATSYSWALAPGSSGANWAWSYTGGTVNVGTTHTNVNITLRCTASNSCGSIHKDVFFTTGSCPMMITAPPVQVPLAGVAKYSITPNPTSGTITIKLPTDDPALTIQEVAITNSLGTEVQKIKFSGGKTQTVDMQKYPAGVYVIRVFNGKGWLSTKVIKQ